MTINLEILKSAYIYDLKEIQTLNTKLLVPKMITRRRLTRAAKIVIYLANEVSFSDGKIIYGSSYGELSATANILDSIKGKESISPTHFQNSVYNTAISYLSMLHNNKEEIVTISSGDKTSDTILKAAAVKALENETILLMVTETLDIKNIHEINHCQTALESGVALTVRLSKENATINIDNLRHPINVPNSIQTMFGIAQECEKNQTNIIKVTL